MTDKALAARGAREMNSSATVTGCDHIERILAMVTAPRTPVVLPPLPPHPRDSWGLWDDDEKLAIEAYASAALAQYGIVDRQEDAA